MRHIRLKFQSKLLTQWLQCKWEMRGQKRITAVGLSDRPLRFFLISFSSSELPGKSFSIHTHKLRCKFHYPIEKGGSSPQSIQHWKWAFLPLNNSPSPLLTAQYFFDSRVPQRKRDGKRSYFLKNFHISRHFRVFFPLHIRKRIIWL